MTGGMPLAFTQEDFLVWFILLVYGGVFAQNYST